MSSKRGRPRKNLEIITDMNFKNGELEVMTEKLSNKDILNLEEEVQEEFKKLNELPMDCQNPEWTSYVLSHLRSDELKEGNPTCEGLRRVTELLIGEIIESTSEVNQSPSNENGERATVTHTLLIRKNELAVIEQRLKFSGSADVYKGNTNSPYSNYPVSTCDTRAESKALRRALKLKSVVAAEEIKAIELPEGEEKISGQQLQFIDILCGQLNLNVEKLVVKTWPENKNIGVNALTFNQAQSLFKTLSEYRQNPLTIEEELKGYTKN